MKATLKLQLIDSSENGCVCFGDIMTIPYSTPEELFTAIFGTEDIDVSPDDITVGLDKNSKPQIEIDFFLDWNYDYQSYGGLEMYNKITGFLDKTARNLTSTQLSNGTKEITNEEAESIMNGEMINAGTNSPMQVETEENDDEELFDEKEWLQHIQRLNNNAQEILEDLYDLIVHRKDMDTYYYIWHLINTESLHIENDLYEKFNTNK